MIEHLEIRVSGQVQGVGFRAGVKNAAHSLGIHGSVENCSDNTVLIHAEGESTQLKPFLAWCRSGSSGAVVDKVEVRSSDVRYEKTFRILS